MNTSARGRLLSVVLSLAACAAAAPACGPSTPEPTTPDTGDGPATGDGAASDGASADGTETPKEARAAAFVDVTGSTLLADVEKIGIDLKKPPKLEDIKLADKKKLMPLFQKALGFDSCEGCHAEGDFKKETKNIQMARNMWNHYVVELRDEQGGALFCDSCHNGHEHTLNRQDKDAVQKFMEEQYEKKLTRADGEEHSCSTCHGSEFETKIFEKIWNVK